MNGLSSARPPKSKNGFSLVEVAVSLALVGFALVSILGLVPMGMTNFRQAMNNTVEAQIVQSITNELQLTSFAKIKAGGLTFGPYDADGNVVVPSSQTIYTATITSSAVDGTMQPVNLTNTSATIPATQSVSAEMVKITLKNLTQPQPHVYTVIVANQNN
jgi:uncharacterized protein (TIGR02598 family)